MAEIMEEKKELTPAETAARRHRRPRRKGQKQSTADKKSGGVRSGGSLRWWSWPP